MPSWFWCFRLLGYWFWLGFIFFNRCFAFEFYFVEKREILSLLIGQIMIWSSFVILFLKLCRCIPYRYKKSQEPTSVEDLEVLVISAQNGQGMLFPKVLILCCLHQQARYHHLVFKITVFSHFFFLLTNSLLCIEQGGWENDECMEEAAKRETEEEAGVIGVVQVSTCNPSLH